MNINKIYLSSGAIIEVDYRSDIETIVRKEGYYELQYEGNTAFEVEKQRFVTSLRISTEETILEIKEEEIIAIEYKK